MFLSLVEGGKVKLKVRSPNRGMATRERKRGGEREEKME
jgi:hypothetical protein